MILHCLLAYDRVIPKAERVAACNALMPEMSQCFIFRHDLPTLAEQCSKNFDMNFEL